MPYVSKKNAWKNMLRTVILSHGLPVDETVLDNIDHPNYDFINMKAEYKTRLLEHYVGIYKNSLQRSKKKNG